MARTAIGPKRQRITIERRDSTLDSFGQQVDAWSAVGTFWAEVKTLSGRELATAQQVRPETSSRVVMRGREADVTADMRIDFAGRKMQILAAYDPEELGREIWIDCAEWRESE